MSGDLLRRLFELARAHVGTGSSAPPIGDVPGHGRSGQASQAGERAPNGALDERLAGCYANLEIPYGADLESVRAAWKRMMKKYHPDLHGDDPEKRRLAGELTAELTRAYQELTAALEHGGQK